MTIRAALPSAPTMRLGITRRKLTSTTSAVGLMGQRPPRIETSPLNYIMAEIRAALDAGLYYAAVSMTLSVPDICSALETNAGHSRFGKIEPRYKAWCKQYMEPRFGSFDADDCWAL